MTFQTPLKWPEGWKRGQARPPASSSRFKTTFDKSRRRMFNALEKLGATAVVISSNMAIRMDGTPRADSARRYISDNGVAVYFTLRDRQMVMARDAYDSPFDNFHSLTMAIEYLQGLERHGGAAMMERAFEGFSAIAAPGAKKDWREVLGFPPASGPTHDEIREHYRQKMKVAHPDMPGGSHDAVIAINETLVAARKELML